MKLSFTLILVLFLSIAVLAQDNDLVTKGTIDSVDVDISKLVKNPVKAALYSAVLPGLGQSYNKQYWKIPIVWGAVGAGVGFTIYYNNRYRDFRDAYLASLNGDPTGFPDNLTTDILARAQDDQRRNRDYAIVITTVLYAMNIIDALVAAHLSEMKKDKDLAIHPTIITHPMERTANAGIGIQFNF